MIDIAAAVLGATGPARVSVWTWCIADYEVEAVGSFIGSQFDVSDDPAIYQVVRGLEDELRDRQGALPAAKFGNADADAAYKQAGGQCTVEWAPAPQAEWWKP